MFMGIEALPKIPDCRVVFQIQVRLRMLYLVLFHDVHHPLGDAGTDAPVLGVEDVIE